MRALIIVAAFLAPSLFAQYSPPSGGSGGPPTGAAGGSLSGNYPNPGLASPLVLTGPIQATGFTGDGTKSGSLTLGGVTSGAAGFAVNDIAGTAILYLLPAANGATGQAMYDTGSTTCPTLAAGAPSTCHQLAWATMAKVIFSGTIALGTTKVVAATCNIISPVTATGVLSGDRVDASFNADPTSTTGYIPATTGMLTIIPWPSSDAINIKVCNNTSADVTPGGSLTINLGVIR